MLSCEFSDGYFVRRAKPSEAIVDQFNCRIRDDQRQCTDEISLRLGERGNSLLNGIGCRASGTALAFLLHIEYRLSVLPQHEMESVRRT